MTLDCIQVLPSFVMARVWRYNPLFPPQNGAICWCCGDLKKRKKRGGEGERGEGEEGRGKEKEGGGAIF